jgi:Holliday junction resolvase
MPINSRQKGARGERAWRDQLREHGFAARRGQQFSGGGDSPDVVCEEMGAVFHCEVKAVERLNIRDAMRQAERDAGERMPYVAHKTNREPWLVTLRSDDFLDLVRSYLADHQPQHPETE